MFSTVSEDFIKALWGERFYTTNLGIIGLGLSLSETDLWWLLTHRASLYYQNYAGLGRELIKNTIVYYDVIDERPAKDPILLARQIKEQKNKLDLLKNLHVEVCTTKLIDKDDTYEKAYESFLNDFDGRQFDD